MPDATDAPGWPGILPRWTSSAKSAVGTAANLGSTVWFTLSHGILNEIYFPRLDQACTRDLGLIVTDGKEFFSEEKRDAASEVRWAAPGIPAFHLINTCNRGHYRIEKDVLADPQRAVVLQRTRFSPLSGNPGDYRLYVLLAPHLGNHGVGNTAWVGEYKGVEMLFAERDGLALAVASSAPWLGRSAGFVGTSDGWQDLSQHKHMEWQYQRAVNGNVALTGEVDLSAGPEFLLAIGFGANWAEAAQFARASLVDGFDRAAATYSAEWRDWQRTLLPLDGSYGHDLYRASATVLRVHESKLFPGGLIASLSIPWGFSKGDDDLGGYHLVWPRDLVESAGGLLAAGAVADARRVLEFLRLTQEADGHWPQNMWLDGRAYWSGIQMDETAFPILLVDLLRREGALPANEAAQYWPMVRRALSFLVCNGPVTGQDRWEEDPGYSPFTLAVEIAALLAGADMAEEQGEAATAGYVRETADAWNESIERWCYVAGTDLAREFGVSGYYIRIAPAEVPSASSPKGGYVPIKNRPPAEGELRADHLVSPDFLALVRFGLRAADDPRIRGTLKLVDTMLKVELPQGPLWRRYNRDGYGEHQDGSPFDGTGVGRAWPLLAGERAHYELSAGNRQAAERLLRTLQASADAGGLISEQSWDEPDMPERELWFGRPSGSARPLVWAHAEYVKLVRSLHDGRVFDQPLQAFQRYQVEKAVSPLFVWAMNNKARSMPAGMALRISLLEPALIHWSDDGWQSTFDTPTRATGLGTHIADLPTEHIAPNGAVVFALYWQNSQRWEETDFRVSLD